MVGWIVEYGCYGCCVVCDLEVECGIECEWWFVDECGVIGIGIVVCDCGNGIGWVYVFSIGVVCCCMFWDGVKCCSMDGE